MIDFGRKSKRFTPFFRSKRRKDKAEKKRFSPLSVEIVGDRNDHLLLAITIHVRENGRGQNMCRRRLELHPLATVAAKTPRPVGSEVIAVNLLQPRENGEDVIRLHIHRRGVMGARGVGGQVIFPPKLHQ